MIYLAIALIPVFAGLASLFNRVVPFKACAVCVGVSGSWFTLSVLTVAGVLPEAETVLPIAVLMGGTVAGMAGKGEQVFVFAKRRPMAWKFSVMLPGFLLAFWAVHSPSVVVLILEAIVLAVAMFVFFIRPSRPISSHVPHPGDPPGVKKIEEKLESCC